MDYLAKRIIEKLKARGEAEQQRAEEWQRSLKPTIYRGNNLFQELGGEPIEGRYLGQVGLVPGQSVPNIGRNPNKPVIPGLPLPPAEAIEDEVFIQESLAGIFVFDFYWPGPPNGQAENVAFWQAITINKQKQVTGYDNADFLFPAFFFDRYDQNTGYSYLESTEIPSKGFFGVGTPSTIGAVLSPSQVDSIALLAKKNPVVIVGSAAPSYSYYIPDVLAKLGITTAIKTGTTSIMSPNYWNPTGRVRGLTRQNEYPSMVTSDEARGIYSIEPPVIGLFSNTSIASNNYEVFYIPPSAL